MRVLVDTTAISADVHLVGLAWQALLRASKAKRVSLLVPEVVVKEAAAHFRRQTDEALLAFAGQQDKWGGKQLDVSDSLGALSAKLIEDADAYEALLRKKIRGAGGRIVGIPRVSHGLLVDRATSRHKPCDSQGNGYRDTLNWLLFIQLAKDSPEPLVWVSDNWRDFGVDADTPVFHPQLLEELDAAAVAAPVVWTRQVRDITFPKPVSDDVDLSVATEKKRKRALRAAVLEQFEASAFLAQKLFPAADILGEPPAVSFRMLHLDELEKIRIVVRDVDESGNVEGSFELHGTFRLAVRSETAEGDTSVIRAEHRVKKMVVSGLVGNVTPGEYPRVEIDRAVSVKKAEQLRRRRQRTAEERGFDPAKLMESIRFSGMIVNQFPGIAESLVSPVVKDLLRQTRSFSIAPGLISQMSIADSILASVPNRGVLDALMPKVDFGIMSIFKNATLMDPPMPLLTGLPHDLFTTIPLLATKESSAPLESPPSDDEEPST